MEAESQLSLGGTWPVPMSVLTCKWHKACGEDSDNGSAARIREPRAGGGGEGRHLDVQGGEVVQEFPLVADLRLGAGGADQVGDVLLFHGDGEVQRKTFRANCALARGQ